MVERNTEREAGGTETDVSEIDSLALATKVLSFLAASGVAEICICPGRRNAAFVALLEKSSGFRFYSFFEERSAAFFALGRIKLTGRPVAVITTSGTACAELLPATIEAFYTGLPLVLVTADRPPRYRGTGAPQVIDQVGLFGTYVERCIDIADLASIPEGGAQFRKPWHLNVCFDEPVVPAEIPALSFRFGMPPSQASPGVTFAHERVTEFLRVAKLPLILVGELSEAQAGPIASFLQRLGAPVYAEASSQLRDVGFLKGCLLRAGNNFARSLLDRSLVDAVLRIGGVPSPRVWRDLDEKLKAIPVLSLSENEFPGLGRGECLVCPLTEFASTFVPTRSFSDVPEQVLIAASDSAARARLDEKLSSYPHSEVSLLSSLAAHVPRGASVYLGNSLPIREWEIAVPPGVKNFTFAVNRGANGIDGQTSTFLGWCAPGRENWAFLGDLTALYDLSSPWALRYLDDVVLRIVVINNGGGQIFSRMFESKLFLNEHSLSFRAWAEQWGLEYCEWSNARKELPSTGRAVIEIRPDPSHTAGFWNNN